MNAIPEHWRAGGNIRFADVRQLLENEDLAYRNELLTFVRQHVSRIRPAVKNSWLMIEMVRYYLDCIAFGPSLETSGDDETFHSPFEAASQLVRWFDWYRIHHKKKSDMPQIVDKISEFYRSGSESQRNCIETGFLEHAFEHRDNRIFFNPWENDPILCEAHREALKWAVAHEHSHEP